MLYTGYELVVSNLKGILETCDAHSDVWCVQA